MDGVSLIQAGMGQPFLLHVIVRNTNNSAQYPEIKGVDTIHIRNSGFQMNIVNGATSITYQYHIRIDRAGDYTIGPACLGTVESEPIKITVGTEQKTSEVKRSASKSDSFLRLKTDKAQAVIGEKIRCILTFYTSDTVSVQNIIEPEFDEASFTIKNKEGPFSGVETVQAKEYRYLEWHWDLYPKKQGINLVPSYAVEFTQNASQSLISYIFGQAQSKRTYSNTISLQIDSLPAHKEPISFIGTLDEYQAKLDQSTIKIGQGALLTISLKGNGSFNDISLIPLHGMPESLKWYESKHSTHSNQESTTHIMEYILQATTPGTFVIPSQIIHYFDTHDRVYKSKTTLPLTIFVNGTIKASQTIVPIPATRDPAREIYHDADILPLHMEGPWVTPGLSYIPWHLFWIITALSIFTWFSFITLIIIKKIRTIQSLFIQTRTEIQNAYEKQRYSAIHTIFMHFFSVLLHRPSSSLQQENITTSIKQWGLSEQELKEWNLFFSCIEQACFYNNETIPSVNFYTQSIHWIDRIEKLYRRKR